MKRLIMVLVLSLLTVGIVSAVEVRCDEGRWNSDICRDFELQDEFDLVEDQQYEQDMKIYTNMNDIGTNEADIRDVEQDISSNRAAWLQDSSGTSMSSVQRFAFGDFLDFIKGLFADKSLEDKYYVQEAKIYFLERGQTYNEISLLTRSALIKMEELDTNSVDINEYSCVLEESRMTCLRQR